MKTLNLIVSVCGTAIAVLGLAMANTNPPEKAYQDYAVKNLSDYAKENVCSKAQGFLEKLVAGNCPQLIDAIQPQVKDIVTNSTHRQDFIIFSIYRTDFKLNSLLPSYTVETVGAFNNFYIYRTQKQ
jgi:Domain of unknown function (DUF4359)